MFGSSRFVHLEINIDDGCCLANLPMNSGTEGCRRHQSCVDDEVANGTEEILARLLSTGYSI
jgi:hypothetical protein